MKATLEFTLPDESAEYNDAMRGVRYRIAIQDCLNELRSKLKYGDVGEGVEAGLEMARQELLTACRENGFDPWEEP